MHRRCSICKMVSLLESENIPLWSIGWPRDFLKMSIAVSGSNPCCSIKKRDTKYPVRFTPCEQWTPMAKKYFHIKLDPRAFTVVRDQFMNLRTAWSRDRTPKQTTWSCDLHWFWSVDQWSVFIITFVTFALKLFDNSNKCIEFIISGDNTTTFDC